MSYIESTEGLLTMYGYVQYVIHSVAELGWTDTFFLLLKTWVHFNEYEFFFLL